MEMKRRRHGSQSGLTLVELIVAFTILMVLTGMAVPLARYRVRLDREKELRWALKEMRDSIDEYKDAADAGMLGSIKQGTEGYPEELEIMVEGVPLANQADDKKIKFLRRIPRDPFTGTNDWGKRSVQDAHDATSWGGENVFDVYSKTLEKAKDGTPYSQW